MTTEELQNIFFERMNKKLAGVVSLNTERNSRQRYESYRERKNANYR